MIKSKRNQQQKQEEEDNDLFDQRRKERRKLTTVSEKEQNFLNWKKEFSILSHSIEYQWVLLR